MGNALDPFELWMIIIIQQGCMMSEDLQIKIPEIKTEDFDKEYQQGVFSFIRSRLNIIGTSVYLLESKWVEMGLDTKKYFQKINDEIESIRRLING